MSVAVPQVAGEKIAVNAATYRISEVLGTTLLCLSGLLAVLIFADRQTDAVLPFPSFWYTSRVFHLPMCVTACVLGWLSHRHASQLRHTVQQQVVFQTVTVYSRSKCPLCDTALQVLREYARFLPSIHVVMIDGDEFLEQKFGQSIPVVEIDGRVRFRGIVSAELLERMIAGRQRQQLLATQETAR